jgi:hypothetical protein
MGERGDSRRGRIHEAATESMEQEGRIHGRRGFEEGADPWSRGRIQGAEVAPLGRAEAARVVATGPTGAGAGGGAKRRCEGGSDGENSTRENSAESSRRLEHWLTSERF